MDLAVFPDSERATLRAVGPHLVIAPPGAEQAGLAAALDPVRVEPRTLVLLAAAPDAAPVLRASLGELARIADERGADTLVLAASGLAAAAADGRRPAELLARRLGLAVIAPDAVVSVEADGTLLAPGGSWWRCRPDGRTEPVGERWPGGPAISSLRGGGFWVTPTAPAAVPPVLELAAGPLGTLLLVLGEPGGPLPTAVQLAAAASLVLSTAGEGRLLLSAPWADPLELVELAAVLAASLARQVHAAIGLPLHGATGRGSVHLGPDGAPGWEPYLTELVACPVARSVTAVGWRSHPGGWTPAGPARFHALPGWELEAISAGLWLRPAAATVDRAPRLRRPDPVQPVLVIGARGCR